MDDEEVRALYGVSPEARLAGGTYRSFLRWDPHDVLLVLFLS